MYSLQNCYIIYMFLILNHEFHRSLHHQQYILVAHIHTHANQRRLITFIIIIIIIRNLL